MPKIVKAAAINKLRFIYSPYYFDQDADTIQWVQEQRNIIDARTGRVLREEKRPKAKLITLKPDTYGYMQAIYWRDLAVAAGQLK